jgi:hypothetical protein
MVPVEFRIPRIVCTRTVDLPSPNPRSWVEPLNWSARHLGLGSFSVSFGTVPLLHQGASQAYIGRWSARTSWPRHAYSTFCFCSQPRLRYKGDVERPSRLLFHLWDVHLQQRCTYRRTYASDPFRHSAAMGGTASNTRQRALLPSPGSQGEFRVPPQSATGAMTQHLDMAVSASGEHITVVSSSRPSTRHRKQVRVPHLLSQLTRSNRLSSVFSLCTRVPLVSNPFKPLQWRVFFQHSTCSRN